MSNASGTTWSDTSHAWVGQIMFDGSKMGSIPSLTILPLYPGFDQAVGQGVTVDSAGKPVVVGDVISQSASFAIRGAEWVGSHPTLLQSKVGASDWIVTGASGINPKREIAAEGVIHGTDRALLLIPTR